MDSRERVLTAFAHQEPDRVPRWCGASAEFWEKAKRELGLDDEGLRLRFGDDFRRVSSRPPAVASPLPPGVSYVTPFGVPRTGLGYGQPTCHPLAQASLKQIEDYPWPDPRRVDVSHVRAEAAVYGRRYAILGGEWSPFWHDLIDLLGMEQTYYLMYDQPKLIDAVLTHLVDYYATVSQRVFDSAASALDVFFIGNDFGSQQGPLLTIELFRSFIMPHLQRLVDLGHAYGLRVMMHCCGGFAELIPTLIEIGLDGLHAIQPCCRGMDLRRLKADFGSRILFNGAIDSHHVLIESQPSQVREKTREVLQILMPGGGYVAGASHDTILGETPVENVLAMFDAIQEYGVY